MPAKSPTSTKRAPQDTRKSARIGARKDHTSVESQHINNSGSEFDSDLENPEEYSRKKENSSRASASLTVKRRKPIKSHKCPKCDKGLIEVQPESASSDPEKYLICYHCQIHVPLSAINKPKPITEEEEPRNEHPNPILYVFVIVIVGCALFYYFGYSYSSTPQPPNTITIELIKKKFPNQEHKLWKAVASGLNDTIHNNYPTSYVFLYQNKAEKTTENLLKKLSEYAVCQLTTCNNAPVNFKEVFDSYETDYGSILTQYKPALENSGVMIVENLDQVPEKFALAFHSFCDGISPLVEKSAFFFSMEVDEFGTSPLMDVRYVGKRLKEKWSGIKDDQLGPLLTRITAMLLRVNPEKEEELSRR